MVGIHFEAILTFLLDENSTGTRKNMTFDIEHGYTAFWWAFQMRVFI